MCGQGDSLRRRFTVPYSSWKGPRRLFRIVGWNSSMAETEILTDGVLRSAFGLAGFILRRLGGESRDARGSLPTDCSAWGNAEPGSATGTALSDEVSESTLRNAPLGPGTSRKTSLATETVPPVGWLRTSPRTRPSWWSTHERLSRLVSVGNAVQSRPRLRETEESPLANDYLNNVSYIAIQKWWGERHGSRRRPWMVSSIPDSVKQPSQTVRGPHVGPEPVGTTRGGPRRPPPSADTSQPACPRTSPSSRHR